MGVSVSCTCFCEICEKCRRFTMNLLMSVEQCRPTLYRYTTAKKKRPKPIGLFSWNLVITNCMQCFSLWANWLQLNSQLNSPGVSFWLYRMYYIYMLCIMYMGLVGRPTRVYYGLCGVTVRLSVNILSNYTLEAMQKLNVHVIYG